MVDHMFFILSCPSSGVCSILGYALIWLLIRYIILKWLASPFSSWYHQSYRSYPSGFVWKSVLKFPIDSYHWFYHIFQYYILFSCGGFLKWWYPFIAGWFIMENPIYKWMIWGYPMVPFQETSIYSHHLVPSRGGKFACGAGAGGPHRACEWLVIQRMVNPPIGPWNGGYNSGIMGKCRRKHWLLVI